MIEIDWNFGLDDLADREHYFKTMFSLVALYCITFTIETITGIGVENGGFMIAILGGAGYSGLIFLVWDRAKRAERINQADLNLADLEQIEEIDGGVRNLKQKGLDKLKEGEDLTWRDVY